MKKALRGSSLDASPKCQENQRTKKSSKSFVNTKSKSPKHSSHKGSSSPQRTKEGGSSKCRDPPSEDSAVNGHNNDATLNKTSGSGSDNLGSRTPSKHINSPVVIKLCSGATPKSPKSPHISRHKCHKSATNGAPQQDGTAIPEVSDEQWIDGPRVSKSKMLEGHKVKGYELETWIDGPEATYGYMDDHKKNMIQKWVETQNNNVPSKGEGTPSKNAKHPHYKELTQFKTVDDEEVSPKHKEKHKEKRRSGEGKESKRDSKTHHLTTKDKDSPHRRKSYTEKSHLQADMERSKSQINASNSTPSKSSYYHKDSHISGTHNTGSNNAATPTHEHSHSHHQTHLTPKMQGKSGISATDVISKGISNSQNRSPMNGTLLTNGEVGASENQTPPKSVLKTTANGGDPQSHLETSASMPKTGPPQAKSITDGTKLAEERKLEAEEEEDVLQIIYIQNDQGNVDTKIRQKLSQGKVYSLLF